MKKFNFIAILLILALLCGCAPSDDFEPIVSTGQNALQENDTDTTEPPVTKTAYLAKAQYPTQVSHPEDSSDFESWEKANTAWLEQNNARRQNYEYLEGKLDSFISSTVSSVLGESKSNAAYSPFNLYMALSMLAQTAEGESQAQMLKLLDVENADELATLAKTLFNAHYQDDGTTTVLPANALFLRDDMSYKSEVLQKLSENYYASVLQGKMGTDEYDTILQEWINEQTKGLLSAQANQQKTSKEHMMILVSTLYFSANWHNEFAEANNTVDTFYGKNGESQATYMHRESKMDYYVDEYCSAVNCAFSNSGGMWLILPNEEQDVNGLLQNDIVNRILDPEAKTRYTKINLSLPKFDIVSTLQLNNTLKSLGVQDAFDQDKADFSPLTDMPSYVTQVAQNVRVTIDEEGCTAAAYTIIYNSATSAEPQSEPIDFTLDRPFIFIITAESGLPLFVGVVQNP